MLEVDNEGVPIEGGDALFDPMVSKRDAIERRQRPGDDTPDWPHLGLGLFIARLIARRHGRRIEAVPLIGEPESGCGFRPPDARPGEGPGCGAIIEPAAIVPGSNGPWIY